ncbi:D-alanyl-D-alanine carboxypeptidase, partial [Klebsiella pneumoniae]
AMTGAIVTGKKSVQHTLQVVRRARPGADERLEVGGTLAAGAPMQKIYRSVTDDLLAAGEYVRAFLLHEGITISGHVKPGVKPPHATLLLTLGSYEMRRIVAGLNTFSNNYIADVLVKRLGAAFPVQGP